MRISPTVQSVLSGAIVQASAIALPPGKLDRKLYVEVDKVLRAMGGRWDRRVAAHVFDEEDPADALDRALATGSIVDRRTELQAFFTPPQTAAYVISKAALAKGMRVLEPSAGRGALAAPALLAGCYVSCVEIDPRNASILCSTPYDSVVEADFLALDVQPVFDRVVMNPPFAKQADIAHVRHAYDFLRPGGRLVAIMSASVRFRTDRNATSFREFALHAGASLEDLPAGSFKESGTSVSTRLVTIEKDWRE